MGTVTEEAGGWRTVLDAVWLDNGRVEEVPVILTDLRVKHIDAAAQGLGVWGIDGNGECPHLVLHKGNIHYGDK